MLYKIHRRFYTIILMKCCHFRNLRAVNQMPVITHF
jgi:hypothetical protein